MRVNLEDFQVDNIYGYDVRYVYVKNNSVINVKTLDKRIDVMLNASMMFNISDIFMQYRAKTGSKKEFKRYLETKQAQELLMFIGEQGVGGKSADPPNNSRYEISGVIQLVDFDTNETDSTSRGYLICEELLNAVLMWLDPSFAWEVCCFLKECRLKDQLYLEHKIEFLNEKITEMEPRVVSKDKDQNWSLLLLKIEHIDDVMFKTIYRRTINISSAERDQALIIVNELPNGFTMKTYLFEAIKPIIEKYSGQVDKIYKTKYYIPANIYNDDYKTIDKELVVSLVKTVIKLKWEFNPEYTNSFGINVNNELQNIVDETIDNEFSSIIENLNLQTNTDI